MDFSLNEEQTLLRDSVAKYLANDYAFEQRRAVSDLEHGFSPDHWANFAELGWLTIPIAEAAGGYGGKVEDTAVLLEEFGKHLVLEPYLANVLLAGQLIARSGNSAAIANVLSPLLEGTHQSTLAACERQSRQNYCDVLTTASEADGGYVLNGSKVLVANGGAAASLVVTARSGGSQFDRNGISLFVVEADAEGVMRNTVRMMDGTCAADITLNNVAVSSDALLGQSGEAYALLDPVLQEARIAVAAMMLGIMDELFSKTLEYTKTREQFGTPISSFQALQHRMVDMFMGAAQSRSMLYRAICEYQQGDSTAPATVAAMKSLIGKSARQIGSEAIQMHGGMGMTDELDIGHYVKSAMMLNQWFGDSDTSLREFCDLTYRAAV